MKVLFIYFLKSSIVILKKLDNLSTQINIWLLIYDAYHVLVMAMKWVERLYYCITFAQIKFASGSIYCTFGKTVSHFKHS